ncbi:MAG: endonuclease/exonuclease/phosphatase family protein [Thiohalospira sp.]
MKKIIFVFAFVLFAQISNAGDTLKIMHYNLLYYGKNYNDCDDNTNDIDDKNEYLKTIIQHVNPDIFTVNELDGEGSYPIEEDAPYLLDNALNVDGFTRYRRTEFPEIFLANTVFYNYEKLTLKRHYPLSFYYPGLNNKVFNVYQFYFNADDLAETNDTVFVTCIVAHLKAGNSSDNLRAIETEIIMNYLENSEEPGNILLLGDLNVYTPSEEAFQNLINPDYTEYAFNDPANQIGEWHKNYEYRYYHTQSTHTSSNGCYSSGGMDDRFDFILASNDIITGNKNLKYIDGSYTTIGQDGSSFDVALNTTSNSSVPNDVAQALYKMSDHLPVYLELEVGQDAAELLISNVNFQPEKPGSGNDVTVFADLTDKNGQVNELSIKYGYSSENYEQSILMNPSGYSFAGIIPKHEAGTEIFFKVTGLDDTDEEIISSDEYFYTVSSSTDVKNLENYKRDLIVKNPVQEMLQFSTGNILEQKGIIELISSAGEVCMQKAITFTSNSSYEVHLQNIKNGIYFFKFTGEKDFVHSQKVVIQK